MSIRQDEHHLVGEAEHGVGRGPVTGRYHTEWGEGAVTVRGGRLVAVDVPGDAPSTAAGAQLLSGGASGDFVALHPADRAALERWTAELEAYFRGERLNWTADEILLGDLDVAPFARRVYEALLAVPAAATVSYGALADLAGYPRAARAVGNAMATNPIPIVVPCHRVIRSDGTYGNYGHDPGYKVRLLAHEKEHVARAAGGG